MVSVSSMALADNGITTGKGKELFTGTQLGTNNRSCNACHPDGKGLAEAATYKDGKLEGIINKCIEKALKGKALDPTSNEMQSLVKYIETMALPAKP